MKKLMVPTFATVLFLILLLSGCGPSKDVVSTIASIDAIGEVTLDSKSAIEAAETAYDNLPEKKRSDVTSHGVLVQARDRFEILVVMASIDAIGAVTLESDSAIKAAEAAYNALTVTQQGSVNNYKTLEEAIGKYSFIKLGHDVDDGKYFVFSQEEMTIEKIGYPDALNDFGNYFKLAEKVDLTIEAIHKTLALPNSLREKMGKTSILDGSQTETYGAITVTWSFDPGGIGLAILYEYK